MGALVGAFVGALVGGLGGPLVDPLVRPFVESLVGQISLSPALCVAQLRGYGVWVLFHPTFLSVKTLCVIDLELTRFLGQGTCFTLLRRDHGGAEDP